MLAALDRPGMFWRRTDQSFLQDFFPDWHGLAYDNLLQHVWFNLRASGTGADPRAALPVRASLAMDVPPRWRR